MTNDDKAMLYDYLTEQMFAWASENYLQYTKDLWKAGFDEDSLMEELVDNCKKKPEEAQILIDRALAKDKHEDELIKTAVWSDVAGTYVYTDKAGVILKDNEKKMICSALMGQCYKLEHEGEYEVAKTYRDLMVKVDEEC